MVVIEPVQDMDGETLRRPRPEFKRLSLQYKFDSGGEPVDWNPADESWKAEPMRMFPAAFYILFNNLWNNGIHRDGPGEAVVLTGGEEVLTIELPIDYSQKTDFAGTRFMPTMYRCRAAEAIVDELWKFEHEQDYREHLVLPKTPY